MDRVSDLAAELLQKELGRVGRGPGHGPSADGSAVVHGVLSASGVPTGSAVDGSGLSSRDRQSAAGQLTLLRRAQARVTYLALRGALPVACRQGTLQYRLCGPATNGRVSAETGTLDTVHALTGWTTADGHLVRFSFLLAGFTSGSKATAAIDRAVVVLASARTG